ncbi:DUF1624 domain-containing protein [Frigidibacter mobilis]|uniref:Heparan-alpha-glucosaminide N-acetyltransferase catalytic domain-containing protein n=1 Tax=Frigidibacter mobilis TaxID=1335048 RepID=A0A159Z480_9RHOB|nr:heparan-alpha-glucosaminide N-acetyltransferase [Frigidibacter mobilis]AMY69971.1 hypothetical protein AKL17_2732 [Frigidibacter mobilis]
MTQAADQPRPASRVLALDLARTAALACMAVFHFTFDLQLFGYLPGGTTTSGGWAIFARAIAGSFLFLAGVSLALAHGRGIRWRPALRRLARIAGAAAAITIATRMAIPDSFIFFGILHSIAFASLAGLAFVRLPPAVPLLAALAVFLAPRWLFLPAFDAPWLQWTGLGTLLPRTVDFVPVFPWFAPVLLGIAFGNALARRGVWARLAAWPARPSRPLALLAWPGQHSLAVYLVHQPVLIALVWTATQLLR